MHFCAAYRSVVLFPAIKSKGCLLAQLCVYSIYVYALHIVCSSGVDLISVQVLCLVFFTSAIIEAPLSFHNQLSWKMKNKKAHTNCLGIMTYPYLVMFQIGDSSWHQSCHWLFILRRFNIVLPFSRIWCLNINCCVWSTHCCTLSRINNVDICVSQTGTNLD